MSYVDGDPLDVRIRIAFGAVVGDDPATWVWTDVTDYWHTDDEVTITWGRSPRATQAETATMSLTLKNTDGRFTSKNATSPYWPNVVKWTPISYDVDLGDGVGWRNRFSGYIRKLPVAWPGRSSRMALARIEAVGILGRLNRGSPPERSSMRRTVAASGVLAHWPAEDGEVSTLVGSAVAGVPAAILAGTPRFAEVGQISLYGPDDGYDRYGLKSVLDLSAGASVTAAVPATVTSATTSAWTVHILGRVPPGGNNLILMEWDTPGGTFARWRLIFTTSLHVQVIAYDAAGAATTVIDSTTFNIAFAVHDVSAWQSGGTINVGLHWFAGSYQATGSVSGTLGGITGIRVNQTGITVPGDELPVGHLAIWGQAPMPYTATSEFDTYGGVVGGPLTIPRNGEAAHLRLARLADEDGLAVTMPAVDAAGVTRMGDQPAGTPLDLYAECERTDGGLLFEAGFGLGYLPRVARYNPPVALTIDAAAGQLGGALAPVDDDTVLRTRWTVERSGGTSATAVDEAAEAAQGEIEGTTTVSLSTDDPLADHAGWRLHLAADEGLRWPSLPVNVGSSRDLAADWCDCAPGSRVQVLNPPSAAGGGPLDQIIVGATETYRGRRSWRVSLNAEPTTPWLVAVVDDGTQRVSLPSTLTAGISATALSMQLTTSGGVLWTTKAAMFPLDLNVDGERVTVSVITGTSSPQTATITARAVNGITKSHSTGAPVDVWSPAVVGL